MSKRNCESRVLVAFLACGLVFGSLTSKGAQNTQEASLFETYKLFLIVATDNYDRREGKPRPIVDSMNLGEKGQRNLVALSANARNQDLSFQRKPLSEMCTKSAHIQTKQQLAEEYAAYAADIKSNQERLAAKVLMDWTRMSAPLSFPGRQTGSEVDLNVQVQTIAKRSSAPQSQHQSCWGNIAPRLALSDRVLFHRE